MPNIEFNEDSFYFIEKISQKSQHLIRLLDKAYAETVDGDSIENLALLIDGLADYATVHFYFTEHVISKVCNVKKYREEHKALMDNVLELQDACRAARPVPLNKLSTLINLLAHQKMRVQRSRRFLRTATSDMSCTTKGD